MFEFAKETYTLFVVVFSPLTGIKKINKKLVVLRVFRSVWRLDFCITLGQANESFALSMLVF